MRKTFNSLTTAILMLSIVISAYFMYNFEPDRNITGFKTFYRSESYSVTIGKEVSNIDELNIGDKVLLYQDEQSTHGLLVKKDEFTINDHGILMTIVDEDAIIYKDLLSFNALYVGGILSVYLIIDAIRSRRNKANK